MNRQDTQCFKGVGILFMLIFHVFSQAGHMSEMRFLLLNENMLYTFSMGCQLCVSIFVFVSAYGTAATYRFRQINNAVSITKYTGTRYIKLMFEFWFVYMITFLIAGFRQQIWPVYGIGNWKHIWTDFMGMYMKYATPTLNSSWWFMSMAVSLIFLLPIFILLVQKIGMITAVLFGWGAFSVVTLGLTDYFYVVLLGIGLARCDFLKKLPGGVDIIAVGHG